MPASTVRRSIARLEEYGHLRVRRRRKRNSREWDSCLYAPVIPAAARPSIERRYKEADTLDFLMRMSHDAVGDRPRMTVGTTKAVTVPTTKAVTEGFTAQGEQRTLE